MTDHPMYRARLSAPVGGPHGERPPLIDPKLIEQLREARRLGDDAMTEVERLDPDFSVKLSACTEEMDAQELLDDWLGRRFEVLRGIQGDLRRIWEVAQRERLLDKK